jgi:hypothetical protein
MIAPFILYSPSDVRIKVPRKFSKHITEAKSVLVQQHPDFWTAVILWVCPVSILEYWLSCPLIFGNGQKSSPFPLAAFPAQCSTSLL